MRATDAQRKPPDAFLGRPYALGGKNQPPRFETSQVKFSKQRPPRGGVETQVINILEEDKPTPGRICEAKDLP